MARIGIMGGTFNPIHNGHLHIADAAFREYSLDEIWFMPNHIPAYKSKAEMISSEDRMHMVRLAIENKPGYILNTMEIERGGKTYTADTLRILHEQDAGNRYYFIIGADSLETFPRWYHPQEITKYAEVLVAARADADEDALRAMIAHVEEALQVQGRFHIIHHIESASASQTAWIASSRIRQCISMGLNVEPVSGQDLTKLLPPSVYHFIKEQQLY